MNEALLWRGVSARPMFGMTALYRGSRIFAALPRSRAIGSAHSVAFKLPRAGQWDKQLSADKRIRRNSPGQRWISFELYSGDDITQALQWLQRAFDQAR